MEGSSKSWGAFIEGFAYDLVDGSYASVLVNLVNLMLADYPRQLWSHLSDNK